MEISVIGLGYVGTVTAACLADSGHQVIGVDVDQRKVDAINAGRSPVIEPGLDDLMKKVVASSRLRAIFDVREAIAGSSISFVCVGTPSQDNGALDLKYVEKVTLEIGEALRDAEHYHVVAFRSTMLPGTVEERLIPILEEISGRHAGRDFGVVMNPEFLREGSSLKDFHRPSRLVVGELDAKSGDVAFEVYPETIEAPRVRSDIRSAEILKYADNAFHALKISFANEIGVLCRQAGIDSRGVMESFCLDTKLNLSPVYFKPGAAFGGSCLPKDLRAILHFARSQDLSVPVLEAVLPSNEAQKKRAFELVRRSGKKKVGILGLSFKSGTDDLRESPAVDLAESLIGKGFDLAIYDRNVSLARLIGANRAFIEREIPHIASLMRPSLADIVEHAEVLVVTTPDPEFRGLTADLPRDKMLIDLVGLVPGASDSQRQGICW